MELYLVLTTYFIVLIILIFVFYKYGIYIWSSIILSIIFSFLILNILKPLSAIDPDVDIGSTYILYIIIQVLTPIIVFIYAILMAFNDTIAEINTCSLNNDYFGKNWAKYLKI